MNKTFINEGTETGSSEGWSINVAIGGFILNHNWEDSGGRYRNETYVFTSADTLATFLSAKFTNEE